MLKLYITHPDCKLHEMGAHHPESPDRLRAIENRLTQNGLFKQLTRLSAPKATRAQLALIHPEALIDYLFRLSPSQGYAQVDPDTLLCPSSINAALRACGAAILAVEQVMSKAAGQAFCAVRPPGHHAEESTSMGFCLFNNVAIAAAKALSYEGIARVAILDFDVHHCNGTVDIFKDRPEVLICSTFQHPYYPNRYADIERDHIVNCPLPAGAGSTEFRAQITERWLPAIASHHPDFIFISAGFDAHHEDPLADINLVEADYYWVTQQICKIAAERCEGRVVSVLEGGYNLDALARSVESHLRAIIEAE